MRTLGSGLARTRSSKLARIWHASSLRLNAALLLSTGRGANIIAVGVYVPGLGVCCTACW